jgi:FkbM family methyltransferase
LLATIWKAKIVQLSYNLDAAFTQWVVKEGHLQEPFVVLEVGVQGGEHKRWEQLGDRLVLHGFDAIEEAVTELKQRSAGQKNRHYHWIAAGAVDEDRVFYFNQSNPTSSSMYPSGKNRFGGTPEQEARNVAVRRLDTLFQQSVIPRADFLKVDVEGFEKDVFLGASELLAAGVLGVETESNFGISPTYPKGHFVTLHDMLLDHQLLVFDIGFNRIPRASFQSALARVGRRPVSHTDRVGKPATLDVLFCRDPIDETDHPENYLVPCRPFSLDQLIKMIVIYELHGLNDIAVDIVERFANRLGARLDVGLATRLLADPHCRPGPFRRLVRNAVRSARRRTLRAWA